MRALIARLQGWFELGNGPNRIVSMEGLRGFAILLVFTCHFQMVILSRLSASFQGRPYKVMAEFGGTGVDLFFLLSGMLIYRAALKPNLRYLRFMARRVQRIYPTFVFVTLLYLVFQLGFHKGEHFVPTEPHGQIKYLVENILLLPGIIDLPPIISAAWSLSYEFAFYLVLPLIVCLCGLSRWQPSQRILFWSTLIAGYCLFVYFQSGVLPDYQYQDGTFVRFCLFLSGMVLQDILQAQKLSRWLTPHLQWFLLAVGICATIAFFGNEWHTVDLPAHRQSVHAATRAILVLLLYSSIASASLKPGGVLAHVFSLSPLRYIGNISYSFYLIHGLTLNVFAVAIQHLPGAGVHSIAALPFLFATALGGTLIATVPLFLFIEKPFSLRPHKVLDASPMLYPKKALAGNGQEL